MTLRGARRPASLLLLAVLAGLPACARVPVATGGPETLSIERNTSWSGTVRVDGIVHVRKGATLTLHPGTRIVFAERNFPASDAHEGFAGPGFKVDGVLVAEGTDDAPILFTTAAPDPRPGAWDKIFFAFGKGSLYRCVFEGARYAVHAHFSQVEIRNCTFRNNEEGVRLGNSRVTIEESFFTENAVRGINYRECRNTVRRNVVTGNGDGVFLHSKGGQSVLRENAIFGNRGHNLRLGDLHADDVDVSGNWWGTSDAVSAARTVYDGRAAAGIGRARIEPVLARSPVGGSFIAGLVMHGMHPVDGARVRAYNTATAGFLGDGYAGEGTTDPNGAFRLDLPPGRYYVTAIGSFPGGGELFAYAGRNPVPAIFGETVHTGLSAVPLPPRPRDSEASDRPAVVVTATLDGTPAASVSVHAFRSTARDLRGRGEASAVTGTNGTAVLYLAPGSYLLAARKRADGASAGAVKEGGLFGIDPYAPVEVVPGRRVHAGIPLFERRGILFGEDAPGGYAEGAALEGTAFLDGRAAEGHVVYLYPAGETIGRPVARSSVADDLGRFTVAAADGEYDVFLLKAAPGGPVPIDEVRVGPVRIVVSGRRIHPLPVRFPAAAGPAAR